MPLPSSCDAAPEDDEQQDGRGVDRDGDHDRPASHSPGRYQRASYTRRRWPTGTRPYEPAHPAPRPRRRRAAARLLGRGARAGGRRVPRGSTRAHGPDAVGFFSCSKATNEMNFLAQKFARSVIGTNNIDSCNRT